MTEERYALAIGRIREMAEEQTVEDARFRDYFRRMADFVMMTDELRTALSDGSYEAMEIEELRSGTAGCTRTFCRGSMRRAMPIRRLRSGSFQKSTGAY